MAEIQAQRLVELLAGLVRAVAARARGVGRDEVAGPAAREERRHVRAAGAVARRAEGRELVGGTHHGPPV